jgi:hypothetical protein
MALLKSGSTVGGNLIWHQGILPIVPAGDSVFFKNYKIYSEKDKPSKAEVGLGNVTNDAQVKKSGDTMTGNLKIDTVGNAILDLKSIRIRADTSDQLVLSTEKKTMYFRVNGNDSSEGQMTIDNSGTVRGSRFIVTDAQNGSAGALTRKDYVDGKVTALEQSDTNLANTKVAKAGDTMTGNLTAPVFLLSAGQNSAANAATRKDYVDGRANEKVAKAGDTMTGLLSANQGVSVNSSGSNKTNGIYPGNGDASTWETCNVDIKSWYGIGIRSDLGDGKRTVVINARTGDVSTKGTFASETSVRSPRIDTDVIYRRSGTTFVAADGNLNLVFSGGSHSSGFKNGYLLEQIKGFLDERPKFKQHLQKRNLNDVREPGFYHQDSNANTPGLNYPEDNAGSLEVYNAAGIIQVYRIYNTGRSYQRAFYNTGPWTPWTRNFSYGDPSLAVGYTGVSGLGNNSIAIGDNDTGFRQVGDGLLEVVANSQRIARFDTTQALFDKNVYAPTFAATGGSVYTRGDGNCHYWFSTANGSEKAVIYAGADKQIHYRSNGGLHVFENRIQAPATGNQPSYGMSGSASGGSGCVVKGLVESGGWGQWRDRASGLLVEMPLTDGAVNIWKAVMWGRDWPAGMDVYLPSSGPAMAKLHIQGADFDFSAAGDFTTPRDVNANNVYIRSDERLKNNFRKIENAIDKVEQLTGFIYDKKISLEAEDYTETEAGIIAQSLQKVLPEAVSEREGLLNVSSAGVNALLINAINELSERLKKLEGEK